uniref:ATPase dynein-related AAA domain-containing protein n=1 Tax=Timema tahoe TaxID=61484 RepID=A0A7R9IAN0_9NEOP|nr:unnamed protein product [Timema tahoe]
MSPKGPQLSLPTSTEGSCDWLFGDVNQPLDQFPKIPVETGCKYENAGLLIYINTLVWIPLSFVYSSLGVMEDNTILFMNAINKRSLQGRDKREEEKHEELSEEEEMGLTWEEMEDALKMMKLGKHQGRGGTQYPGLLVTNKPQTSLTFSPHAYLCELEEILKNIDIYLNVTDRCRADVRFSHCPQDHLDRLHTLAPSVDPAQISHLVSCCYALLSQESASLGLPDFPADNLETAVAILLLMISIKHGMTYEFVKERFPSLPPYEVLYRLYPYKCFVGREGKQAVEDILNTFNIIGDSKPAVALQKITLPQGQYSGQAQLSVNGRQSDVKVNNELVTHSGGHMVESLSLAIDWTADDGEIEFWLLHSVAMFQVPCGSGGRMSPAPSFVHTPYQDQLLAEMLQSHLVHDICLIGPRGCGKSATVRTLSDILGYNIEPIVLYQDMSSRDLIQQRTTLSNGDTVWKYSPLVTAALEGKLVVLDGVHRIHPSTLAVVHSGRSRDPTYEYMKVDLTRENKKSFREGKHLNTPGQDSKPDLPVTSNPDETDA